MTDSYRAPPLGDLDPAAIREHLHHIADWVADYRENIEQQSISPTVAPGDIAARMTKTLPPEGESLENIVADLDRVVMPGVVHWGHPSFVGYFGSTSNGPALLGEIVAAALNVSAMTWKTSPSATEMENVVVRWILEMLCLPEGLTGIVYDTASIGLMHALAAAREQTGSDIRKRGLSGRSELPVFRIYASAQAHSSIEKAAIVLGIGEDNVIRIECDVDFRMKTAALREAIDRDIAAGYKPLAVIATIGTTSTASADDVAAISDVCQFTNTWLHVDAAYGGGIAVLPERRWLMAGCDRADSLIVNPHKWLFVPLDFSVLYVRNPGLLKAVFSLVPEYLRGDAAGDTGGHDIDYMDYGIQLGRRFRALKAWFAFRAFGRDGIASRVRECCRLARLFADAIEQLPDFEIAAPVTMAVVCFRWAPEGADASDADRVNEAIVASINASGTAYLTHTTLAGRTVMRIGIGNMETAERHVRGVLQLIVERAAAIAGERIDR